MPRSLNENENVHFVQELAEVDGPFESPININFRELIKIELPPLTWNRSDIIPKKMKVTNTGHTVIISGKWKCERPYLTGGPLLGRYVFSQIHFHWGQDDHRGSEHQVNGEGFPLEMHVAHFKTEYITQESALRERDGMVIVVYLFKLQEEPNTSLKKIIHNLPSVNQASTSHPMDPRPIISLCNPFSEDYFMYWGSVVTSTCAHILLWIVCREPFGISREQVKEFRKILDPYQQPIARNNRETQPLHKRNVFHVNASKYLSEAMLPPKKVKRCHCRRSDENLCLKPEAHQDCICKVYKRNQEDIEENHSDSIMKCDDHPTEEVQAMDWKENLGKDFYMRQSMFVHSAIVQSVPLLSEKLGGHGSTKHFAFEKSTKSRDNSKVNLTSHSCCFFPMKEENKIKRRTEKRKSRGKEKMSNSINPMSQIMESLDAIKNQTFKKLKEIDLLNQEIVGLKFSSDGDEQKKWFRRLEKIISRQKRLTVRSSQGYFTELKKLAKEYTVDRFFDRNFTAGDNKMVWLNEVASQALYYSNVSGKEAKEVASEEKASAKPFSLEQAMKFTAKAKSLIQSFFEDIKENEELQNVQEELRLKKRKIFCNKEAGDSTSMRSINKNYITQKMFTLGNLGDRFFTEVTAEDVDMGENGWGDKKRTKEVMVVGKDLHGEQCTDTSESEKTIYRNLAEKKNTSKPITPYSNTEEVIPLHRVNVAIKFSSEKHTETVGDSIKIRNFNETKVPYTHVIGDTETSSCSEGTLLEKFPTRDGVKKPQKTSMEKQTIELASRKLPKNFNREEMLNFLQNSTSSSSTESEETHRMIVAKLHNKKAKKFILGKRSSLAKFLSRGYCEKSVQKKEKWKNINLEGYYIRRKNSKSKRKRIRKEEKIKKETSSLDVVCLTGKTKTARSRSKWKKLKKTKFKLEIEKPSTSISDSTIEFCHVSPRRKKLKLESKRFKGRISSVRELMKEYLVESDEPELDWSKKQSISFTRQETIAVQTSEEYQAVSESRKMASKNTATDSVQKLEKALREQLKRIPWSNLDEYKASSKESKSSLNFSKNSSLERVRSKLETKTLATQTSKINTEPPALVKTESVRRERPTFFGHNSATKIKSLTNLTTGTKYLSPTNTHRGFVENLEHRWKSAREQNERRPADEYPGLNLKCVSQKCSNETQNLSEIETDESRGILTLKFESLEISNESQKKSDTDVSESHDPHQFNVGFFTTVSRSEPGVMDDVHKFITEARLLEIKPADSALKPCFAEKYLSLHKDLEEIKSISHEPSQGRPEMVHKADSNRSLGKDGPNMKGDVALSRGDNNELQTSVSYTPIKNKPQSRPHSAESLGSLTKAFRRKTKKRPHCCKRSSRHHIRKNPSVLRKLNKVQSKPLQFLDLTEEEQLKIISVNVAKYLKEKLEKPLENFQNPLEKSATELTKNEKSSEENIRKTPDKETISANKTEIKPEESTSNAVGEGKKEIFPRAECTQKKIKPPKPSEPQGRSKEKKIPDNKKPPSSPRPIHDFIKHNKLMAGKYKRQSSSSERKNDSTLKKKDETKTKTLKKKKDKQIPLPKRTEHAKVRQTARPPRAGQKPLEKVSEGQTSKDTRARSSFIPKKPKPEGKKTEKPPGKSKPETKNEGSPPSLTVQRIPQPQKRFTPTYALTSYLPTPVDIVQKQQQKMNRSLVNLNETTWGNCLPEILYEPNTRTRKKNEGKNDSLFMKDLEHLIKLQMCLNNEISANIENSMNYVKTMLSQDFSGTALIGTPQVNESVELYDHSKKVVLIEMNDSFECSSSSSEYADEPGKCFPRNASDSPSQTALEAKELPKTKAPGDFGDYGIMKPALLGDFEIQEDYNSDSSYNCEISITLNAGAVEKDNEIQVFDTNSLKEIYNYTYDLAGRSSADMPRARLEGNTSSQSIIMKPLRKKRKENEISMEMKQKLLEILEGEIKREMAASYGISTENLSDALTVTWEDSDGMNRSHSTESSCDNVEIFAQISETMRQYLTDFKERRLVQKVDEPVDNESKDEDAP